MPPISVKLMFLPTVPSLILNNTKKSIYIDFSDFCKVGKESSRSFLLVNPFSVPSCILWENYQQILDAAMVLLVKVKGDYTIPQQDKGTILAPQAKVECKLVWTPSKAGPVRVSLQVMNLKTNLWHPIFIKGRAIREKTLEANKENINENTLKSKKPPMLYNNNSKVIPITKVIQPPTSSIIKKEVKTKSWIDEFERSLKTWVIYELSIGEDNIDNKKWNYSHKKKFLQAVSCFRILHQSPIMSIVRDNIGELLSSIDLKEDCNVLEDIGLRRNISDILKSYSITWLKYGMLCFLDKSDNENSSLNLDAMLSKFLSFDFEGKNRTRTLIFASKMMLSRILELIIFLDKAKLSHLLPGDPGLFRKTSRTKSSLEILQQISYIFIKGEGDLRKRFFSVGCAVSYSQKFIEEIEVNAQTFSKDLVDGIQLCKLLAILLQKWEIYNMVRVPLTKAENRRSNISLALSCLPLSHGQAQKYIDDISSENRERICSFVYEIFFHCKFRSILDHRLLNEEISTLSLEYKKKYGRNKMPEHFIPKYTGFGDMADLLLQWCDYVCSLFGYNVADFSNSIANGKALLLLVHYYHPSVIRSEDIYKYQEPKYSSFAKVVQFLETKYEDIGFIPINITRAKLSLQNLPDERTSMAYLAFLGSNMISIAKESRAAKKIQVCFRKYIRCRHHRKKVESCIKIQRLYRNFILRKDQRERAAIKIQSAWKEYHSKKVFSEIK